MTMGERIKELRKKSGMTQTVLAKELDVTKGTVSTWETGSRTPSFEALSKMSDMFEATYDYLMGKTDTNTYHQITEKDVDELARMSVEEDLTEYALKYARLDEYGKQAVESVIIAEFNRCRAQDILQEADVYSGHIVMGKAK